MLRGLANWERLIIVETFAPENADATGRSVGEVAAARGRRAVRHPARHRDRRRVAHRTHAGAVRRRRRRLAAARRGVALAARRHRRLGRRRPPRHDVRRDLHDVAARPRCPRAPGGDARGSGPAAHRCAGPALRAGRTGPDHAGLARRLGVVRSGHRRPRAGAHPLRLARGCTAVGRRRPRHHLGAGRRRRGVSRRRRHRRPARHRAALRPRHSHGAGRVARTKSGQRRIRPGRTAGRAARCRSKTCTSGCARHGRGTG